MNFLSIFSIFSKKGGGGGGGDATWGNIGGNINNQTDLNNEFVKKSTFLNTIYPKGSTKFMFEKINPSTFLGGVWELIEEGYYPVSQVQEILDEENERYLNAELPNIKGDFASRGLTDGDFVNRGAFGLRNVTTRTSQSYGTNQNQSFAFDASKGQVNADGSTYVPQEESVYKNGGKVQPKSVKMYIYKRTDNGTLTYNFVNISFSDSDFTVDAQGRISLKNSQYVYTKDMLVSANDAGTLISTNININDIVLKQRKVAGISLDHDITETEIQNAIKEVTAILKNKTINADNNTILNLTIDNFKSGEIRTSVRDEDEADDTHLVTEKAVRDAIIEAVTGLFKIKGNKETIAEIKALTETEDYEAWTCSEDGHLYYWLVDKWLDFPLINIDEFVKKADKQNIVYGTGNDKKQKEYGIIDNIEDNYYYQFIYEDSDPSNKVIYYTKILENGSDIDVYDITLVVTPDLKVKVESITKLESKGVIAEDESTGEFVLIVDGVYLEHRVSGDGIYIVKPEDKLLGAGTLDDLVKGEVAVDNTTIDKDANGRIEVKDEGITFAKFNPNLTKQSLANDYYFEFSDGTNTYYTKTIVDGNNIDVFSITITDNKITAITLQEAKGTLANGVLTFSSVEYAHDIFGDGFYVVGDDEILITISALQDILEKAGKVNDVKFGNKSIVNNKEAVLEKIDNLEDNYYYAFKNGSNYIYIKSKSIGTNKNTYLFTYTDNVLTNITLSDKKSEIKLNDNGTLVAVYDSVSYGYDYTKNNYYIISPTDKTSSIQASITGKDIDKCFEDFYITPQNNGWNYIGILSAGSGSSITIQDNWSELLVIARLKEGSSYFNYSQIIPKVAFTVGSPTNNCAFFGFWWNSLYEHKARMQIQGTGVNRLLKINFTAQAGWECNGYYVYKR